MAMSIALLLAGCSSPAESPSSNSAQPSSSAGSAAETTLTVWIDKELESAFLAISGEFAQQTGIQIKTEVKDFFSIEQELPIAQSGSVDVFVGSSDWTDSFAESGLVDKLASVGETRPAVQAGFQFQGIDYGTAYATENLALICNRNLVSSLPTNWLDLEDSGITVPLNSGGDPYTLFYVESSFGDSVFDLNQDGDYSRDLSLGQATEFSFAKWLAENQSSFSLTDSDQTIEAFSAGDLPCWVSGNWALPMLSERVDFELLIGKLPSAGGAPAKTFASSRGFFQSAGSNNKEAASKLMELLASSPVQQLIFESTGRTPATDSFMSNIQDLAVKGFMAASQDGVPIPPADQMQYVWGAWGQAQVAILGGQEPEGAWTSMVRQISDLLGVDG